MEKVVITVPKDEWEQLHTRIAELEEWKRELVSDYGTVFEDERVGYVAIQIPRETWLELEALRGERKRADWLTDITGSIPELEAETITFNQLETEMARAAARIAELEGLLGRCREYLRHVPNPDGHRYLPDLMYDVHKALRGEGE